TCPTPKLADVDGHWSDVPVNPADPGVLTLHMGPRAGDREEGENTDENEQFIVRHISGSPTDSMGETVEVTFNGLKQTYSGVKSIVADGGEGSDIIDLRGVLAPATVTGGNAGDTLYAGKGGGTFHGNGGDDTIVGQLQEDGDSAGVNDNFFGEDGADTLTGNEGDDTIDGGGGPDVIYGNAG